VCRSGLVVAFSMAPPRNKARSTFQKSQEAKFGLRICERDSVSGGMISNVYRFCVVFGHDEKAESDDQHIVVVSVGKNSIEGSSRISRIVAERNSSNEGGNEFSAVLPHQVIKLNMRKFISYVDEHRESLDRRFSAF
jgi:hypothetical protein